MVSKSPYFGAFKPSVLDGFVHKIFRSLGASSSGKEFGDKLTGIGKEFAAKMTPFEKVAISEVVTAPLGPIGDIVQASWLGAEGKNIMGAMSPAQKALSGVIVAASFIKVSSIVVRKSINTWKKFTEKDKEPIPPYRRAYQALEGIEKNHGAPYWSSPTNLNYVVTEGIVKTFQKTVKQLSNHGGLPIALFNSRKNHTLMGAAKHQENLHKLFNTRGW